MIGNRKINQAQHPISLSFKDRATELSFRAKHAKKNLTQIRIALIIAAFLYGIFAIVDFIIIPEGRWTALMVRFGFAIPVFLLGYMATYRNYFRKRMQSLVMAVIYVAGIGIALIAFSYQDARSDLHLTGTLLPIFWAFLYSGLRFINAVIVSLLLTLTYDVLFISFSSMPFEVLVSYNFFLFTSIVIGILGGYTIECYSRRDFVSQQIIRLEKQNNEQLLLNILPKNIAKELKASPGTIAKDYESITVLFADLVAFSELSQKNSAHEVVSLLNEIFSVFDKLTDTYGLEKIKTIGDAYMVTNNLKQSDNGDVKAVAEFAFDIQKAVEQFSVKKNQKIQLRIGVHTGPAVAGVIGVKKFVYDVWGNTVNIASRLESRCPVNKIQVSESTYQLLKDDYHFEDRGELEVKGQGKLRAYILLGPIEKTQNDNEEFATIKEQIC